MKDNLPGSSHSKLAEQVDKLASQCVKCALCLPYCPTYNITEDENESPRGRIALFQATAQQQLPLTAKVEKHLDLCLGCRACERVCPAHVEYGQLLVLGRSLLRELPTQEPLPQPALATVFLSWLTRNPRAMRFMHQLLWWLQISGLRRLGRWLKLPGWLGLQKLDNLLPSVAKPINFATEYEPMTAKRDQVSLFMGCMTSLADQETLKASIFVLRQLGYGITLPAQQTCCGAIDLHAGEMPKAYALAQQNLNAFKQNQTILTLATGCSAVLEEYSAHFQELPQFSPKPMDIVTFLVQQKWASDIALNALPFKVIIHTPCTRRNVLKSMTDPEKLLSKIPRLQLSTFSSPHCCGAAGTYMLEHQTMAQSLAEHLLAEIQNNPVDFIVTTNIGCSLHLQQQINTFKRGIKVIHPITLLARALGLN